MLRITCLAFVVLASACIADPHFDLRSDDATTTPVSGEDDEPMVLVPATVIVSPGTLAPSTPKPKNEDDDKGNKGKGKDAGNPGDPPAPAPSETSETTVPAFWLDAFEVSAAAYGACVRAGGCALPASDPGCTLAGALGAHPINCVTLEDARAYCAWRGKRLPTSDELTAASAGQVGRAYPWGGESPSPERLNACGAECASPSMYPGDDGHRQTAPRGSHPLGKTPEGVHDLAGNVAEWADLRGGASLVRGGSFLDVDPAAVTSTSARAVTNGGASVAIGFRCAKDG